MRHVRSTQSRVHSIRAGRFVLTPHLPMRRRENAGIGMRPKSPRTSQDKTPTAGRRSKESPAVKGEAAPPKKPPEDKVLALRSALRAAPKKRARRSRSPLKAAVVQLLPDLLAFRSKGYSGVELAEIMGEHGFVITARTLTKYIAELRSDRTRKKKTASVKAEPKTATATSRLQKPDEESAIAQRPSFFVAKPLAPTRRSAKEVLGHRFDDDV